MELITNKLREIGSRVFENLRFKLFIFILVLLVITTFVFSVITVQTMDKYMLSELIKRAESLSRSVSASATHSLLLGDILGIDNIVSKVKDLNTDVEYIAVVDIDMKAITHTDVKKRGEKLEPAKGHMFKKSRDGIVINEVSGPSGKYFEILTPVIFRDKQLGTIFLGLNKSVLLDIKRRARDRMLIGFAATLLLGIVGIFMLSYFITRPIKELSSGVNELKEGKRSRPLRVYSKDELGKLTESFNEMTELITEQQQGLNKYAQELEEAYVSVVRVLAASIDARDPYTLGHSTRVAILSLKLGEAIGLSKKELEDLKIACLFHDVGKLKTPDFILQKTGILDSKEYRDIMRHPEDGVDILSKAPSLHKYIPSVRHHHEWYNGKGYPRGLNGEEIPLFAAIISIADAFDAMTSTRPYRNSLSEEEALRELVNLSGKQFNPHLVEVFVQIMNEHKWPVLQPYGPEVI
jgi:putative nucleotidyltransferase with HDIG domain